MTPMLKDVLEWWIETLRSLLSKAHRANGSRRMIIRKSSVELDGFGVRRSFSLHDEAAGQQLVQALRQQSKSPPILAIEASRYVLRTLSPMRLPTSRARMMAALDRSAATPFADEDVHCLLLTPVDRFSPAPTRYAIVKRSILAPALAALRSARIPLETVVLLPPDEDDAPKWLLQREDVRRLSGPPGLRQKAMRVGAAALAVALVVTLIHAQWNYATAQTAIEETMPALEAKAKTIRAELNRQAAYVAEVDTLRRTLVTQRPVSEILEEISRVLPDSAYLTDLDGKAGSVSIIGFSSSAPSIIAPIESSPMFDGAEFASPVTRTPDRAGDRFAVTINVLNR